MVGAGVPSSVYIWCDIANLCGILVTPIMWYALNADLYTGGKGNMRNGAENKFYTRRHDEVELIIYRRFILKQSYSSFIECDPL